GLSEAAKREVGTGSNQIPDMSAFAFTKGNPLSYQLPGGLILKAGNSTIAATEYTKSVTFPVAFPNACIAAGPIGVEEATSVYAFGQCVSRSAGGLLIAVYGGNAGYAPNTNTVPVTFSWFAVGY
ncbi:gp53-like domain-containing protein, partial [Pantoea sp. FN0305]